MRRRSVTLSLVFAAVIAAAAGFGCGKSKTSERVFRMGEAVQVGPLVYTVVDAEWLDQLGDGASARVPKNRFLAVRLSVTNGGVRQAMIPAAELVNVKGETFPELGEVQGLSEWLGMLRMVDPAQTEHGRIVFDVPLGDYRMRISDDADLEEQKTALIALPYQAPTGMPRADTGTQEK